MKTKKRLIDADALKERFLIVAKSGGPVVVHVSDICAAIEDEVFEESVDAEEVVRGHWIIKSSGHGEYATNWAECSECHVCGSPQWKRCPVCEAKMEV